MTAPDPDLTTLPGAGITPDSRWVPNLHGALSGDDNAALGTGIFSNADVTDAADYDPSKESDQ
jgi:hypothetical protein